jgi:hypothetical protein
MDSVRFLLILTWYSLLLVPSALLQALVSISVFVSKELGGPEAHRSLKSVFLRICGANLAGRRGGCSRHETSAMITVHIRTI